MHSVLQLLILLIHRSQRIHFPTDWEEKNKKVHWLSSFGKASERNIYKKIYYIVEKTSLARNADGLGLIEGHTTLLHESCFNILKNNLLNAWP